MVAKDGLDFTFLPRHLEYLRQKYNLTDTRLNEYWKVAAQHITADHANKKRYKAGSAQNTLALIQLMRVRDGLISPEEANAVPHHKILMQEAHSALSKGLGPPSGEHFENMMQEVKSKIVQLESLISAIPAWDQNAKEPSLENPQKMKNEPSTKRGRWRIRKAILKKRVQKNLPDEENLPLLQYRLEQYQQFFKYIETRSDHNEEIPESVGLEELENEFAATIAHGGDQSMPGYGERENEKQVQVRYVGVKQDAPVLESKDPLRAQPLTLQEAASRPISSGQEVASSEVQLEGNKNAEVDFSDLGDLLDHAVKHHQETPRNSQLIRNIVMPDDGRQLPPEVFLVRATGKVKAPLVHSVPSTKIKHESAAQDGEDPEQKLSDGLRLRVPASGLIFIDPKLTVNFNADYAGLQAQIGQMQTRLQSSFPRIDTMPYDVSKSQNIRTLQTWLKILVHRWQTRFHKDNSRDGKILSQLIQDYDKSVLDELVRDHNLSNEAAERMVMRWTQVTRDRGDLNGDAEGQLDLDAFDAEGLSFLKSDSAVEKQPQRNNTVSSVSIDKETVSPLEGKFRPKTSDKITSRERSEIRGDAFDAAGLTFSTDKEDGRRKRKRTQRRRTDRGGILNHNYMTYRHYSTSSRSSVDSDTKRSTVSQGQNPQASLPHLTSSGSAHMVSVSAKEHTTRTAMAAGVVVFSNATPLSLIHSASLKKGDVLSVSRIAGIMAAKKCPDLIPLCHPIALTHVGVELYIVDSSTDFPFGGVTIEAKVQCTGPTGVEMEALTAVMGAALSVVDMCKAVDRFQCINDVRVVLKEGGRSGAWKEEGWTSLSP